MAQAPAGYGSMSEPPRKGHRVVRGVSVVLAVGAVLGVGAAAYSRGVNNDDSTANLAGSRDLPAVSDPVTQPLDRPAGENAAPAPARSDAATTKEPAKVKIGELRLRYDDTGLASTSLPISVTNNGTTTRSFDVKVVAKSREGSKITSDTGTAANLRPGQTAQVQVLELVNPKLVDQLREATFEVSEIFAY